MRTSSKSMRRSQQKAVKIPTCQKRKTTKKCFVEGCVGAALKTCNTKSSVKYLGDRLQAIRVDHKMKKYLQMPIFDIKFLTDKNLLIPNSREIFNEEYNKNIACTFVKSMSAAVM